MVRIADSGSMKALNFSSARTTKTLSVAMCVNDPDRSPAGINR
jgi:hypothetical protein